MARDPRFERLPCSHKGTYADDCIVQRVMQHRCYIVATCDRDLKRRIRKVPGVPIMYLAGRKYAIERLPEVSVGHADCVRRHCEVCVEALECFREQPESYYRNKNQG